MHDIFLSYSRKDTDTMQRVKASFRDADFTVWTDEGIEPGTPSWKRAIQKAILETGCLVCILSPDAADSRWVQEELDFAELHEKPIFLILARGNQRDAIPFGYTTHQYVDIRDGVRYETRILSLTGVIQRRLKTGIEQSESDSSTKDSESSESAQPTEQDRITADLRKYLPEPFDLCHVPMASSDDILCIGKYLITNRQFAEFIGYGGYRDQVFWTNEGWNLCQQEKWTQPRYFHDVKWKDSRQPVVGVTWYEAHAFCRWLNSLNDSYRVSLPSEMMWRHTAQSNDFRPYPWGTDFDVNRLNGMGKIGKTTPVDQYTNGASPYGVLDMAGNVWEWCSDNWDDNQQVICGGSWIDTEIEKYRCDFRNTAPRDKWYNFLGFRIAVTVKS